MQTASGHLAVNGLRLFVHRFRDPRAVPSGLTLVLLHGFLDAGATWELVARPLAEAGHDVVAPDLRGFGASDWIGAGGYYHFADYVADVAALLDHLRDEALAHGGPAPRFGLAAHSMGGTVASLYAGANPGRLERLALLEGLGPLGTEPAFAIDRMQAWLRGLASLDRRPRALTSLREAVERLALYHPHVPRAVLESRAERLTRVDATGQLAWAYDPMHRTTAPTPFNLAQFKAFLARIDCPALVVSGGPRGWHTPDESERVACLRDATLAELPEAGHMMHWTAPEALASRLLAFFALGPSALRAPEPAGTQTPSARGGHAGVPITRSTEGDPTA